MKKIKLDHKIILIFWGIFCLFFTNSIVNAEWISVNPPDVSSNWQLSNVYFFSHDEGWAVGKDDANGRGIMLHYSNGNWTLMTLPNISSSWDLSGVYFPTPNEGWAVGKDHANGKGFSLHYFNGNWTVVTTSFDSIDWGLTGVNMPSLNEGWAVGKDDAHRMGVLLYYSNGTWRAITLPFSSTDWELNGVSFPSPNEGWAFGNDWSNFKGILLHYSNRAWSFMDPPLVSSNWVLNGIHFPSSKEGWAVGYDYPNLRGVLLRYSDGTWTSILPPYISANWGLYGVYFFSPSEGWAVGFDWSNNRGVLLHYTEGAWTSVVPSLINSNWGLSDIHLTLSNEGWAVGRKWGGIWGDNKGVLLKLDNNPPTPNPMTWATPPYPSSTTSITMVATTANDSTPPINYFFQFLWSPTDGTGGKDSGWQTGNSYTNEGLQTNHQYGYQIKAKDGANNETLSSISPIYVYSAIEKPIGITFGIITSTGIQVQSVNTPTSLFRGNSGLLFENITNGTNSGWRQNNDFWVSNPLSPNTNQSFRAKARNGDGVETGYSPLASKYTLANPPGAASFSQITKTCIRANWTANSNPSGTQYLCENTSTGISSGWSTNPYWDSCGLACNTSYSFRVKTKNGDGIETEWISLGSQTTLPCSEILPEITVVSPNGGENWQTGTTQTIRWSYTGNPGSNVKIELLKGGIVSNTIISSISIGSGGLGSYPWNIPPNQVSGGDYQIRVTSTSNNTYQDTSDGNFSIFTPSLPPITVTSPNGGENWRVGSIQTVRWSFTGNPGANVKIELLKGGKVNRTLGFRAPIGNNGNGSYTWNVPWFQTPGSDYQIRITSTSNSSYTDTSDSNFTISK